METPEPGAPVRSDAPEDTFFWAREKGENVKSR
jgi:hypothetical protein